MRIYLTGFMGSGKSTIGRFLARDLSWPFLDLDAEIEKHGSQSIPEIFDQRGEDEFRRLECETLTRIAADPAVIATGAGCFIYNTMWMLQNGKVVYLDVPFNELAARIGADSSRPLWRNAERLYEERKKVYLKAHLLIDASNSPEQVARAIREKLELAN